MARTMLGCKGENSLPHSFGSRPWLFQLHGSKKQACTFFDPINNSLEERILPNFLGKVCLGCYGEWILLADELTKECFFLNMISSQISSIPPFPESPDFFRATVSITSPPNTSNCIVILVCSKKTFLQVCSPGRKRWNKVPIKYFNENVGSLRGPSIVHNERLFLMANMGVTLVIDVAPLAMGCVKMTVIYRPLKALPCTLLLVHILVKCAGDLFSLLVHSYGCGQMITHIEVHRLELSCNEMHWRRVQDIGDHAFFLAGQYGRSLPANKALGAQHNCIYVPVYWSDGVRLYKFCLDDQVLSFTFLPETNGALDRLQWAFPTKIMQNVEEDVFNSPDVILSKEADSTVIRKEDENEVVFSRRWDELPIELVELLFPRLSLVDCLRLPSVCKGWSKASSFIRKGRVWPWLMHLPNLKYQSCKFFDPFYFEEYTLKCDAVVATRDHLALRFSRGGWVVVTEGNRRDILVASWRGRMDCS